MAHIFMVYVPRTGLDNLDLGLSSGRWALKAKTPSPDLAEMRLGDLIFLGAGAHPRGGDRFAGWERLSLRRAALGRITRLPFVNDELFWIDEHRRGEILYNPTFEFELIQQYDTVELATGRWLSFEASDALRRGGVSHKAMRATTDGSPLFRGLPPTAISLPPRVPSLEAPLVVDVAVESERLVRHMRRAKAPTPVTPEESRLVHDYGRHLMQQHGEALISFLVRYPDGTLIRPDAWWPSRKLLIEAKASVSRNAVRTAIGQLYDYGRHRRWDGRALLVPARPEDDLLDLLAYSDVDAIWRDGHGFADTADGRFC